MACRSGLPAWCGCSISGRFDGVAVACSSVGSRKVIGKVTWMMRMTDSSKRLGEGSRTGLSIDGERSIGWYGQIASGNSRRGAVWPKAANAAQAPAIGSLEDKDLENTKHELLKLALETRRGLSTTSEQRAVIEEAMVGVEKYDAGKILELDELDGTWLLQYTTAPDVVSILQAAETPFVQVGQIFQKFECRGRTDGGRVKNVVRWSIPTILQENDGATLVVDASFSVVSPRSIALRFEEAKLADVLISEELQGLIAPAVLPRSFLTLQILQFLRTLNITVPLGRQPVSLQDTRRTPVGLRYYLTYLDRDMLLGRAIGTGGIFIFSRTQQLKLS